MAGAVGPAAQRADVASAAMGHMAGHYRAFCVGCAIPGWMWSGTTGDGIVMKNC